MRDLSPVNFEENKKLLWLVAVGFFMQTLDATIVNTALPGMAKSLGESPLRMQAVVVAYALSTALLIPASGWVADRFGTRIIYVTAMALFVLGSVSCALSPDLNSLVASRVVQGVGGAMMLPVGRLAVLRAYPGDAFIRAMVFIAIPGQVGPLMGPILGGWLVEYASWHWIFWINVPIGIIGVLASLRWMPKNDQQPKRRFDTLGFALLSMGMVGVSVALDGMSGMGMNMALVIVLTVLSAGCLAAYWLHASHVATPLFQPALFQVRSLRVGLLGNLFARLGSGAAPYLIPLILQLGLGMSPFHAGSMMLASVTGSMLVKKVAVKAVLRYGYKRVLQINSIVAGLMIAGLGFVSPGQPVWLILVQLFAFGCVSSVQFSAMNSVTLKDMEGSFASSGNSLLSMVQMLSMSMGVAVAAAILNSFADMWRGHEAYMLHALQATFFAVGIMSLIATVVFSQLDDDKRVPTTPSGME